MQGIVRVYMIRVVILLGYLKVYLSFSPLQRRIQDPTFGRQNKVRSRDYNDFTKVTFDSKIHVPSSTITSSSELKYAWGGDNYGDNNDAKTRRIYARTCPRHFLTQRSVQSFMFLCEQCRDPHTVKWIETFSGAHNLRFFHGTGAFNLTRFENWDSFLLEMVEQEKDTVVFSVRSRVGDRGFRKNNPYLKPRFVEFSVEIDPPSLTSRIIAVREQLAEEWKHDLDIVIQSSVGETILECYLDKVIRQRDEEEEDAASQMDVANGDGEQDSSPMFERTAMDAMLNVNSFVGRQSSPLRQSNFDLLMLLATQESVHRVLRKWKKKKVSGDQDVSSSSLEWLLEFYTDRVERFFDGHGRYGRYDDFLEELLRVKPYIKTHEGEHKTGISLVDPLGLAEEIIRTRGEVAREWKEIVTRVPEEHMDLRRNLLAKQMNLVAEGVSAEELESAGEFE